MLHWKLTTLWLPVREYIRSNGSPRFIDWSGAGKCSATEESVVLSFENGEAESFYQDPNASGVINNLILNIDVQVIEGRK